MQQYREAKERHPGMLLLFRIGDFYELFNEDAETAAKVLGLTLTTRDRTITMTGFPHHVLEHSLRRLLQAGQRVAVCEQVTESLSKTPIRPEVTRIVTAGDGLARVRNYFYTTECLAEVCAELGVSCRANGYRHC